MLFSRRIRALGRDVIWCISAHSTRARHKTRKGRAGIDRLGKLIDLFFTHMPSASAIKAWIPYIVRNKRKTVSNGFVRADSSARQAPVRISQAAHSGNDRIFASRGSVVRL